MRKRYKLIKDLPTFKAGCVFEHNCGLWWIEDELGRRIVRSLPVCAYAEHALKKFPNILRDWFEEIPEEPKTVDDLKEGDTWFFINYSTDQCYISETTNLICIEAFKQVGNAFLTREQAEKALARLKAKVILESDTKGFKPNWQSTSSKYFVVYNHYAKRLSIESWGKIQYGAVCFATIEDAEDSIRKHEKEWKTYLDVEELDG